MHETNEDFSEHFSKEWPELKCANKEWSSLDVQARTTLLVDDLRLMTDHVTAPRPILMALSM